MAVRPGAALLDGRLRRWASSRRGWRLPAGRGRCPGAVRAPGQLCRAGSHRQGNERGRQPGRAVGQGPHSGWR